MAKNKFGRMRQTFAGTDGRLIPLPLVRTPAGLEKNRNWVKFVLKLRALAAGIKSLRKRSYHRDNDLYGSYKQNSCVEFASTLELTNQTSHVTNLSFSDWSISA